MSIRSQDIEWKRSSGINQGHNSGKNVRKMTCNHPNLDLVNMNAYIRFGENLSICSQDIGRKRNFGVSQGPYLKYKYAKKGHVTIPIKILSI